MKKKTRESDFLPCFFIKLKRQNDTKQRKTLEGIEKIKNIKEKIQFLLKENGNKKRIGISRFENLRKMIADGKLQKVLVGSALQLGKRPATPGAYRMKLKERRSYKKFN